MDEHTPDDPASPPDSPRPRREPPTIDLEASAVSEKPAGQGAGGEASARRRFADRFPRPSLAALTPFLTAGASGAAAAIVVIAIAWALLGSHYETHEQATHDSNSKALGYLASRIDDLDSRVSAPGAPDAASAARLDGIEKSIAALRSDLAGARARSDRLASQLEAAKSAPSSSANAADLSAIEQRLDQIERTTRSDSEKITQNADKPADDTALRRLVVASMLDISVRQSEPFAATLAAARALASDADALKPLEGFAATGVPNPPSLTRELLTLVPKLSPPAQPATTGSGIVDRLKAGASNLVRIERTDVTGNDRGAIVARITAAAVRNDLTDSRRELELLSPADREPAQGWLDKVKARDAALAAAHHFVNEAMTALAKPAP